MATSATWIRNNMLLACNQYQERQLTEAELKVQRSLQKLSIPDWFLNKRSNPPKILNFTPIESRPPSWKNVTRHNHTLNSTSSPSDTFSPIDQKSKGKSISTVDTAIVNKSPQEKSPEARQKKSPSKSSSPKKEVFDTSIPCVKLSMNISRTFPKVSPSRKIQNINLIFPPGPKLDLSNEKTTEDFRYDICVLKKNLNDSDKKFNNFIQKTPKKRNDNFQVSDIVAPIRTPNVKGNFKMRGTSTPKFSPANLFSSTIIEESPIKKVPSQNILKKSSFFENSSKSNLSDSFNRSESTPKQRRISENLLEKTFIFENSFRMDQSERSCNGTPVIEKTNWLLERNIRSIDPILFEKDETALSSRRSSVRDIVQKMEVSINSHNSSKKNRRIQEVKKINIDPKNSPKPIQERKVKLDSICPSFRLQEKQMNQVPSPSTRFMYSKKKSTELENVVKSKQPPKEKSIIQGLINTLTEKLSKSSLSHKSDSTKINHNLVKKLVNALEKGDISEAEDLISTRKNSINEEDSSSEYEAKSCTTSASPKDTDSSDSDHRPSNVRNTSNTASDDTLEIKHVLKADEGTPQEDNDSVYWIPVSRCKLPRTSSLLSMMSRLSSNGVSPCISPIPSETDFDYSQKAAWGATFHRRTGISKKLFRIDETTIIDSGYSDKSEKSGASCGSSIVDDIWSEDNDSSEILAVKMRKSFRRKSVVGQTFYVH